MNRRSFVKASVASMIGYNTTFGYEEKNLVALPSNSQTQVPGGDKLVTGKIGNLEISRLICGGNLISGFAHSRDLIYVSPLVKKYFTDDKVIETLALCEQFSINTAILRVDNDTLRIINRYWQREGGNLQWIAQCKLPSDDWKSDILRAIDNGADACYLHGGVADALVKSGNLEMLSKGVELIRDNGIPGGIAGHLIQVPIAVEKAGIQVDFYMKTLNAKNYWSAGPEPRFDSVWAETPEETIELFQNIDKPWIAYKVLGAGAIHPKEGFQYAFDNGADFICVGMFDFQIHEDVGLARQSIQNAVSRKRPWRA